MLALRPDPDSLTTALAFSLGLSRDRLRPRLVRREPNPYGDGRSEILNWRLADGKEIELFCKFDDGSSDCDVAYEARVYEEVLGPLGVSALRYYGSGTDPRTGLAWL